MDNCDAADDGIQAVVDQAIHKATETKPACFYTGYCWTCGPEVTLPPPMRWCDATCRDIWEKDNKAAKGM